MSVEKLITKLAFSNGHALGVVKWLAAECSIIPFPFFTQFVLVGVNSWQKKVLTG
jgi:hypothetical protein